MDSELVQRLQIQLLDLRTENCDFVEKIKKQESKLKILSVSNWELEKELKLLNRKNKAFSFLPGQSSRDEILKLQDEIEEKNKILEKQEVDFQRHDEALREEIVLLNNKIRTLQKYKVIKPCASSMVSVTHPLDSSDDSAIDVDELEKKLVAEMEKNTSIKSQNDEKTVAIRELENMVKLLRTDNEDLQKRIQEYESLKDDLKQSEDLASKRKTTSDNFAKEVSQLKNQVKEAELELKTYMKENQEMVAEEKRKSRLLVNNQISQLQKQVESSEVKIIDCNRQIDKLMDENQELQKALYSQQKTREFIERSMDELKNDNSGLENDIQTLKSEKQLAAIQLESERAEYVQNIANLNGVIKNEKENYTKDKENLERLVERTKDSYELKVEEEIEKQRIVERKAAVTVRELKKQLQSERKRADKLQEKIKTIDSNLLVIPERLTIPIQIGVQRDETSSVGSWSLPTEFDGVTILTGAEAESIILKNKKLLESNAQFEEQLRALERNQIQMSEELANREEILKMRVWNTRPDFQKFQKPSNPISDLIMNKISEYTSEQVSSHEQNPLQLRQLNKKLLRMLEEEMTKNVALRKNIEDLTRAYR